MCVAWLLLVFLGVFLFHFCGVCFVFWFGFFLLVGWLFFLN